MYVISNGKYVIHNGKYVINAIATPPVPDPPTGLSLTNEGDSGGGNYFITAAWDAVSGATKYEFRLNINSGGYGFEIDNGTTTSALLGPYAEFTSVCIQVRVTTSSGTSEWSSQVCEIAGDPF